MKPKEEASPSWNRFLSTIKGTATDATPKPRPAPAKAKPAATPAPEPHKPKSMHGGAQPPNQPPNGGSGGGGDGFGSWLNRNPLFRYVSLAFLSLIFSLLLVFGLAVIGNYTAKDTAELIEKTDPNRPKAEAVPDRPVAAAPAYVAPPVAVPRAAPAKPVSTAGCSHQTVTAIYELGKGCLFFDNSASSVGKQVVILVHGKLSSLAPRGDTPIIVRSMNMESCVLMQGNDCSSFIAQHDAKNERGLIRFALDVPPGSGFVANIN